MITKMMDGLYTTKITQDRESKNLKSRQKEDEKYQKVETGKKPNEINIQEKREKKIRKEKIGKRERKNVLQRINGRE